MPLDNYFLNQNITQFLQTNHEIVPSCRSVFVFLLLNFSERVFLQISFVLLHNPFVCIHANHFIYSEVSWAILWKCDLINMCRLGTPRAPGRLKMVTSQMTNNLYSLETIHAYRMLISIFFTSALLSTVSLLEKNTHKDIIFSCTRVDLFGDFLF